MRPSVWADRRPESVSTAQHSSRSRWGIVPAGRLWKNESPNVDSRDIQIPEFTAGIWFDDTAVDIRDRAQKHIFCAVGKCGHQLRRQVLVDRLGELGVGSDLVVERPQHFRNRTLLCEGRNLNK